MFICKSCGEETRLYVEDDGFPIPLFCAMNMPVSALISISSECCDAEVRDEKGTTITPWNLHNYKEVSV